MLGATFISCDTFEKFILNDTGRINASTAVPKWRQCRKWVRFSVATFAADRPLAKTTSPFGGMRRVYTTPLAALYRE
jgi:hypothetical protein